MILTEQNYFSVEAEQLYMGSTQFKRYLKCEAQALALHRNEWSETKTTALLVGPYVDAYFSGTLDIFQAKNSEIFTKSGSLKSEYQQAEYIIQRIERDEMFMQMISGEPQRILTGEIDGVPIKIKIDAYHPNQCLVDLKIIKDFAPIYVDGLGYAPFIEAWGYDIQAALYQEIERQNRGVLAKPLPFYIAAATKEKPEPDIEILEIPQGSINSAMQIVKAKIEYFNQIKQGEVEPSRCEKCAYCRSTKVLTEIKDYRELVY